MATRSTFVIEIPESKRGMTHKYSNPKNFVNDTPEVTFNKRYAEVYHHWDGYPSNFGQDLMDLIHNKTYDEAFDVLIDLVSGGDMSTTDTPYHAWRGVDEPWDNVQPRQYDELPSVSEVYQYIYTADGELMVRDNYDFKEPIPVEKAIELES